MSKGRRVPPPPPTPKQEERMREAQQMVQQINTDARYRMDQIWEMSCDELLSRMPSDLLTFEDRDEFLQWLVSEFLLQKLAINDVRISDEDTILGCINHLGYLFESHGAWGLSDEQVTQGLMEGAARYIKGTASLMELNALQETNLYKYWQEVNRAIKESKAFEGVSRSSESGFIYLIRCGIYHKIGKAKNVEKRMKQIGPNQPQPLQLIHAIPTNNTHRAEKFFHGSFENIRVHGEWFRLTAHQIKMVCDFKEMIF